MLLSIVHLCDSHDGMICTIFCIYMSCRYLFGKWYYKMVCFILITRGYMHRIALFYAKNCLKIGLYGLSVPVYVEIILGMYYY